jgi:DNA topoisomerase-1
LAVFADEAVRENITVMLDANGNNFNITGKRTVEPGWIEFYEPYSSFEEQILPDMEIGQKIKILKAEQLAKETQPPSRYSQGSIAKEMEKRELGTKATRAEILQTLYDRHYIFGKSIAVTKLGETVTTVLKDFCPRILSEELSRRFEEEMDMVLNGRKKKEEVVEEAKEFLASVLADFKNNESEIGKKLLDGLITARREERKLGVCPKCKTGELRIIYSKKSGKRFAGCSNYPKCSNSFPLPQSGMIIPMGKICEKCGLPMIQVNRKNARPFRMCINHECITKRDWNNNSAKVGKKAIRRKVKP